MWIWPEKLKCHKIRRSVFSVMEDYVQLHQVQDFPKGPLEMDL